MIKPNYLIKSIITVLLISFSLVNSSSAKESIENLKFNLPRDLWKYHQSEIATGLFIRINERKLMELESGLKILNSQREQVFRLKDGILNLKTKQICKFDFPLSHKSNKYFMCGYGSCILKQSSRAVPVFNDADLYYDLFNSSQPDSKCNFDVGIFQSRLSKNEVFLNLRVLDSEISNEIKLSSGNKLILLGDVCLKNPGLCEIVNINNSNYENAISSLKNVIQNKSSEKLNYLISNLLTCVEKNDFGCVSKYVLKKSESREEGSYQLKEETKIDSSFVTELKHCLRYESLLPYKERLKSINGKICIFSDLENFEDGIKYKIHSITYPEAFSYEIGDTSVDIYLN